MGKCVTPKTTTTISCKKCVSRIREKKNKKKNLSTTTRCYSVTVSDCMEGEAGAGKNILGVYRRCGSRDTTEMLWDLKWDLIPSRTPSPEHQPRQTLYIGAALVGGSIWEGEGVRIMEQTQRETKPTEPEAKTKEEEWMERKKKNKKTTSKRTGGKNPWPQN